MTFSTALMGGKSYRISERSSRVPGDGRDQPNLGKDFRDAVTLLLTIISEMAVLLYIAWIKLSRYS